MLLMIQTGNGVAKQKPEDIVYMVLDTQGIVNAGLSFIFTDAHAVSQFANFYDSSHIQNISNIIDQTAIISTYWGGEENRDLKLKKEAEFLVDGDIPAALILGFVVFNQAAEQTLLNFGVTQPIVIRTNYYF